MLKYYLQACVVQKFVNLVAWLVSSNNKSMLNSDCLDHILSVKSKIDFAWAGPDILADVVDNWYANRVARKACASAISYVSNEIRPQFN